MTSSDNRSTAAMVRAGLVPYIATWSGERPVDTPVVGRGARGIAYRHERKHDRDSYGVLWLRYLRAPGVGEPQFGGVHPYRQRRAMRKLLCQVCGEPADRNERGILWLVGQADQRPWSGPEATAQPPVCLRCAGPASRACPHLRGNAIALRVRHAPIVGVHGDLYRQGAHGVVSVVRASLGYDDPRVRMLRARQLMRELHDCTIVDLGREIESVACHKRIQP
jgi:hypothetical protein